MDLKCLDNDIEEMLLQTFQNFQELDYIKIINRIKVQSAEKGFIKINRNIIPAQKLSIMSKKRIDKMLWKLIIDRKIFINLSELDMSRLKFQRIDDEI